MQVAMQKIARAFDIVKGPGILTVRELEQAAEREDESEAELFFAADAALEVAEVAAEPVVLPV